MRFIENLKRKITRLLSLIFGSIHKDENENDFQMIYWGIPSFSSFFVRLLVGDVSS